MTTDLAVETPQRCAETPQRDISATTYRVNGPGRIGAIGDTGTAALSIVNTELMRWRRPPQKEGLWDIMTNT